MSRLAMINGRNFHNDVSVTAILVRILKGALDDFTEIQYDLTSHS